MRQLNVQQIPPFGIRAEPFIDGARILITTTSGEFMGAELTRDAALALYSQLAKILGKEGT